MSGENMIRVLVLEPVVSVADSAAWVAGVARAAALAIIMNTLKGSLAKDVTREALKGSTKIFCRLFLVAGVVVRGGGALLEVLLQVATRPFKWRSNSRMPS